MTQRSWSSTSWYRVAEFRPRLRTHARIHRHVYRGTLWFVLQDRASGRFHRFTPEAYRLICMMDGSRTLNEIWTLALEQLALDAVTQDELVRLVGQLYTADVLVGDVPPDIVELSDRGRRMARQKLLRSVMNPLALRVPVFDPDGFLSATLPLVRPIYSILGVLLFLSVVGYGLVLAALDWGPLTANVFDRFATAENVILLLLAYPCVKALHELGHAYSIKRWGGEVHEIGLMFLVFVPVPYVDASDSIAFASKWQRMLVGAAGILVEIFLAALAMIVWDGAEEGLLRAFAFNVMLIGGVSTLLFNGNPLLRFDGYYVLCDWLEIPNLGQRANRYLGYLVQRYGFGLTWAESPVTAPREAPWLFGYAVAAFLYRLLITIGIVGLVATRFFVIGVILAIWAFFLMLILPVLKGLWFVLADPALRRNRGRALAVTAVLVGGMITAVLAVPVPHNTMAEGVVFPRPDAFANATSEGVVTEVFVAPGQQVSRGTALLRIEDPLIEARRNLLQARLTEIERRLDSERASQRTAVNILEEELKAARADLALTEERLREQTVFARTDGRVILPDPGSLVGRFAEPGDLLALVASFENPLIRVAVPEADAELVRADTSAMQVRFLGDRVASAAHVVRASPGLTRTLPSGALATSGGGRVLIDPASPPGRLETLEPVLLLDLELDGPRAVNSYGDRVHVRFSHGDAPIAARLYRAATRIFLKYFAAPDRVATWSQPNHKPTLTGRTSWQPNSSSTNRPFRSPQRRMAT
ncbi:efflux RND transporter periplasmic adaptor subunit [Salipiger mangrovisoli]|uniref:Efflux RND transporter periplasmic adaptor subunit n=1 Tax=Salipiger mangrovisoli TaxID=2865933 RepID=A0ABR9X0C2_9RHOB|nr:efflux RND transporter periplasmic adaptor subunit [Salipiger mangrovisoli]MBE9636998.1 efflux RND transporter periplasmic adaptor subunit [Salipiger mangrovisoli]